MFLFSWFDTLKPSVYICLKVVRSASFLRFDTLRPSPFRPKQKDFWCVDRWKSSWLLRIKKWDLCRKENEMVALRFFATFTNKLLRLQMRLLLRHESCNGNEMVASAIRCTFAPLPLDKTRKVEGGKKNDPTPRGVRSSPFLLYVSVS